MSERLLDAGAGIPATTYALQHQYLKNLTLIATREGNWSPSGALSRFDRIYIWLVRLLAVMGIPRNAASTFGPAMSA